MTARMRLVVAPLLLVLLSGAMGGVFTPAYAERDRGGDKDRDHHQQGGELRDSYDDRRDGYDDRSQRYREPKRPGYPQQPGYPSSPRSYPQPGYPNPIQPGQFRHDPYARQPGRDPYREEGGYRGGYDRDRHDHDGDYDRDQRGDQQRDYPQRDYEQQRNYESNGRPLRPVNDVVRQVEGTYGGKVVGVQQAGNEYRVRVLQRDGRVKTVSVPAR